MTLGRLVADIASRLERAGIMYMITGSLASSFHGEPRTTRDIDIVIDASEAALRRFVDELPLDRFYVDTDAAVDALRRRTQFNVIDVEAGWKLDLIIRRDRSFSAEEMRRRQRAEILGTELYVATAEDTILAKLEWAQRGESERQLRDVRSILETLGDRLDHTYIAHWADQLAVADLWEQVARTREV